MISIITPTYNRSKLLPRMINSVLAQTFNNWELIIMDDGSTDTTEDVVKAFSDQRIKFFKSSNSGASDKRNKGVNLASGKYIIFLDSDDEAKPSWLEELTSNLVDIKESIVTCGWEKYNYQGELIEIGNPKSLGAMFNNLTINFLSGTLLIPKIYFLEIGGYDIHLKSGQHTELFIRLLPILEKYYTEVITIPVPLIKIHLHQGERIRTNYESILSGTTRILEKHEQLFSKHRTELFNYNSIAAVMALRLGKGKLSRKFLRKAILVNPLSAKSFLRYAMSYSTQISNKFYPK